MAIAQLLIQIKATGSQAIALLDQLEKKLGATSRSAEIFDLQLRNVDRTLKYLATGAVLGLGVSFLKTAGQLEQLTLRLASLEGSLDVANKKMDQLVALTTRVPYTIKGVSDAFVKLKAAGINPIVDDQGNGPLKKLLDGIAAFGGDTDILNRATIAIQQMAGKGVISMEELRQQLGEAIPTAIRAMAEGMGISVSQLIRDVSRGRVEFEKGFTAMIDTLGKKYAGAGELLKTTFLGSLMQTRNEFEKFALLFQRSGYLDVFTAFIKKANDELSRLNAYLASSDAKSGIEAFNRRLISFAEAAYKATLPLQSLISMISNLASAVTGSISGIPAEIIGGGILGFILFGKKGALAGALFGVVHEQLDSIIRLIAAFIGGVNDAASSIGLDLGDAAAGGLLGYMIFGKKGALIGGALGLVEDMARIVRDIILWFSDQFETLGVRIGLFLRNGIMDAFGGAKVDIDKTLKEMGLGGRLDAARADDKLGRLNQNNPFNRAFWDKGAMEKEMALPDPEKMGVQNFRASIEQTVESFKKLREETVKNFEQIKTFGGLTDAQDKALQKVNKTMSEAELRLQGGGDSMATYVAKQKKSLGELQKIIGDVRDGISKETDPNKKAGLQKELVSLMMTAGQYKQVISGLERMAGANIGGKIDKQFLQIAVTLRDMNREVDRALESFGGFADPIQLAVDKAKEKFEDLRDKIEKTELAIRQSRASVDQKRVALEAIAKTLERVGEAEKIVEARERFKATIAVQRATQEATNAALIERTNALVMQAENNYDQYAVATIRANEQVRQSLQGIQDKMRDIELNMRKNGGLIPDDVAQNAIDSLKRTYELMSIEGQKFVERAKFQASDWGRMFTNIASSLENSLVSGLDMLVTKTGNATDILRSFYRDITKEVERYLVKMAMMAVFGTGDNAGQGQAMSGIVGFLGKIGAGVATSMGFASGGSFLVGGTGGTDSVPVKFMASPGERVSVETEGQQMRAGSGSWNISINAVDSRSVRELFMREGSALVEAIQQRQRLNRGFRT